MSSSEEDYFHEISPFNFFMFRRQNRELLSAQVPNSKKELRNRPRLDPTTHAPGSQLGPGEHVRSRGRQAPGVGTIMIAPCTQFYFQPPHLEPTHDVLVPELIHADGGGGQPLIDPAEHLIHLLNRGGQKDADVLIRHTMIQFQHAQYTMKRGERA